jgi:crossover junction endodeoxyribonuclease RuvC
LHLADHGDGEPYKDQGTKEVIEEYFDIFVQQLSFLKNTLLLLQTSKIILGVDPGTMVMGYSVVFVEGSRLRMVTMNSVKFARKDMFERLSQIHETMQDLIREYKPHELAIEAPFFGKNVQSMLKLGRAQGIAIAVAMQSGLPVTEYSPRKVKQSITGNGNADKEQVWKMLMSILSIQDDAHQGFDASDALAVAVCHHFNGSAIVAEASAAKPASKKGRSWESFITQHSDRVRK